MSVDTFRIMRLVQQSIRDLASDRKQNKLSTDYTHPKEGMLALHTEWQTLMANMRACNVKDDATNTAIRLAAAALKFAMDIGDPVAMGIEPNGESLSKEVSHNTHNSSPKHSELPNARKVRNLSKRVAHKIDKLNDLGVPV